MALTTAKKLVVLSAPQLWLGIFLVMFGALDVASGANRFTSTVGMPIWAGVWIGITGITGLIASRRDTPKISQVKAFLAFSAVSTLMSGAVVAFYGALGRTDTTFLSVLIMLFSTLEFVAGLWSAGYCWKSTGCACCNGSNDDDRHHTTPITTPNVNTPNGGQAVTNMALVPRSTPGVNTPTVSMVPIVSNQGTFVISTLTAGAIMVPVQTVIPVNNFTIISATQTVPQRHLMDGSHREGGIVSQGLGAHAAEGPEPDDGPLMVNLPPEDSYENESLGHVNALADELSEPPPPYSFDDPQ